MNEITIFTGNTELSLHLDALAPSTRRNIRNDLVKLNDWCEDNDTAINCLTTNDLSNFLKCMLLIKSHNSVKRYLSSIKTTFRFIKHSIKFDLLQNIVSSAGRHSSAPKQANAMKLEDLEFILSAIPMKTNRDHLQAALLSFMFDTMLRRSEIAQIKFEDIELNSDESGNVKVQHTKTNHDGQYRYLSKTTIELIRKWAACSGKKEGVIFTTVDRQDNVTNTPLSGQTVQRNINYAAKRAGYADGYFTGHSLRVGAAVSMAENNIDNIAIAHAGGWQSTQMVTHYTKSLEANKSGTAKLAEIMGR